MTWYEFEINGESFAIAAASWFAAARVAVQIRRRICPRRRPTGY